jgi:hypothetical protein
VFVRVQKGMQKAPMEQTGLSPQINSNRCNWPDMLCSSKFTNPKINVLRILIPMFEFSSKQNGVFMRVEGM